MQKKTFKLSIFYIHIIFIEFFLVSIHQELNKIIKLEF